LEDHFPEKAEIYQEIWGEANFPINNRKGTGPTTVGYEADGEASDWMLG
jgi:hypothetical protein